MAKKKKIDPIKIFKKHHGVLRTAEAMRLGIHPVILYKLRDQGVLECVSRGVFRLTDASDFSHPDLVLIAKKVPKAVICLISALSYYNITTQIPHFVYIALPRGTKLTHIEYPPTRTFYYSKKSYSSGVITIKSNGIPIRIYCLEKTLADCVKFRSKIGIGIVIEALKDAWENRAINIDKLLKYAKICRVEKILEPIIQTITQE